MISKVNLVRLVCFVLLGVAANFFSSAADSRAVSFNDGWRFSLSDSREYADPSFNDSSWRSLTLPHDWAIEGDFSQSNPSGTGGGALPGGTGWYRKTFTISPEQATENVYLDFDGAHMNATD